MLVLARKNYLKSQINVHGVIFDTKLQWSNQVAQCIQKASKALCFTKQIRRYFNTRELLQCKASNYYFVLFWNSEEVLHPDHLRESLKNSLLAASANVLKIALHYPNA
jgi:hypothetical protein